MQNVSGQHKARVGAEPESDRPYGATGAVLLRQPHPNAPAGWKVSPEHLCVTSDRRVVLVRLHLGRLPGYAQVVQVTARFLVLVGRPLLGHSPSDGGSQQIPRSVGRLSTRFSLSSYPISVCRSVYASSTGCPPQYNSGLDLSWLALRELVEEGRVHALRKLRAQVVRVHANLISHRLERHFLLEQFEGLLE